MHARSVSFFLGLLTPALALAQEPAGTTGDAPPPVVGVGSESTSSETPPPVVETRTEEPAAAEPPHGPEKHTSLYMGSPIFLSDTPLDPGFEIEVRSGIKIKQWVPEIGLGARWNWFNIDKLRQQFPGVAAPDRYAGENLTGIWLSLGIRFEPEMNGSKIQPYFSAAFDANLFGFSYETTEMCGFWSCATVRQYDFAPGFSGRVGVRIQPKPVFGFDIGVKPAMTFQGWAFETPQAWLEPYAGFTVMLDAAHSKR